MMTDTVVVAVTVERATVSVMVIVAVAVASAVLSTHVQVPASVVVAVIPPSVGVVLDSEESVAEMGVV